MVKPFCCFNTTLPVALALSVPLVAVSQPSALALSFRFNFDGNSSDEFQAAVREAGETWSSLLKDDVVVDLYVRYTDLSTIGGDILGGAQPGKIKVDYADYVNAAFKDVASSDDYEGVNSLRLDYESKQKVEQAKWEQANLYSNANVNQQNFSFLSDKKFGNPNSGLDSQHQESSNQSSNNNWWGYGYDSGNNRYSSYLSNYYQYYVNKYLPSRYIDDRYRYYQHSYNDTRHSQPSAQTSEGYVDDNSSNNNSNVSLTKAQAKALGILNPQTRGLDGVISINSSVNWDLNRRDGIDYDKYDVATVLQHEIGHTLGLVSGVDALDFLYSSGEAGSTDLDDNDGFSYLTPMDFYRYSSESARLGVTDLTLGGTDKYFSLDGGKSVVRDQYGRPAYFSTGSTEVGGDGYQGSHWKEGGSNPLGVLNPTLKKGRTNSISELDLTLLDVVGWDLEDSTLKKASLIGVDWRALQNTLAAHKRYVISETVSKWSSGIPALKAAIEDASVELDTRFNQQVQERFHALADSLRKGSGNEFSRRGEISQFYMDVAEYAAQRNKQIESMPYEIYNIDENVRKWLDLPTEQLSDRMRNAEITEINRLSNIVKAAPIEERLALEAKLKEAVAPFADEPIQLVQDLLDTSGPSNPIGFGSTQRWWFFYQRSQENLTDGDDASLFYYSEMAFQRTGESVLDESVLGQSIPGQSIIGESIIGQSIPGQSIPGQFIPGVEGGIPPAELPTTIGLQPISNAALSLSTFDTTVAKAAKRNDPTDIPEPSTALGLFGIAVLGAAGCKRKRPA